MKEIKEFQQNALNQSKYWFDHAKDNTIGLINQEHNVLDFNKKSIQHNPFMSMQYSWQVAQARKAFVAWCTLPFVISECYFNTFYEVYRYPASAPKGE